MQLAEARLGRPLEDVISELYVDRGLMQREVAAHLDIDTGTLSRWMRELGIDARPKGRGSAAAIETA